MMSASSAISRPYPDRQDSDPGSGRPELHRARQAGVVLELAFDHYQRRIAEADLPTLDAKLQLLTLAILRLTEAGRALGLVDDARWSAFCRKRDAVSRETERLKSTWVNPRNLSDDESVRVLGKAIEHEHNLFDLLRRPDVNYAGLMSLDGGRFVSEMVSPDVLGELSAAVIEQVEIAAKYSGYIDRQKDEVQRAVHLEGMRLPADLDYMQVTALSIEARQTLTRHRPETLGLASRISGITPASISLLMIHLKKGGFKGFVSAPRDAVMGESAA